MTRMLALGFALSVAFGIPAAGQTAAGQDSAVVSQASLSPPWDGATYPDEGGFQRRTARMLALLAERDAGRKCLAPSTCPDTGLPVRTFAVKGEEVISPYTGRRYTQGDTGFFGPRARGTDGQIIAFGNDPLKQDLPPAIARLLLHQQDPFVQGFLSIPGSLRQHYHFAAVNWCRFYPLVGSRMGPDWDARFRAAVARYREGNRDLDAPPVRPTQPLAQDLIGVPGELLGGGGTENHKTMWRTSGLLYAEMLGPDALVSGYPAGEAIRLIRPMLIDYLRLMLTVGNGEYDSSTYYPYSLRGYLNLYDFSPDPRTRQLAKATLDCYLATYGLKVLNGVHAGAVKRGWPGDGDLLSGDDMDSHLYAWVGETTVPADPDLVTSVHQATTRYRPDRVIYNLIRKNVPLPFAAQIARPDYHSRARNVFQETFYCDREYALGSVAMTRVDNPTQQTVWSLVCRTKSGSLVLGGGQPRYRHPEGHSPYTQTIQHKGTLLLLTGPTRTATDPDEEQQSRQKNASEPLLPHPAPLRQDLPSLTAWWEAAPRANASWLFVPRQVKTLIERDGNLYLEAGESLITVRPLGGTPYRIAPAPELLEKLPEALKILRKYTLFVVPAGADGYSGYTLEVSGKGEFPDKGRLERQGATATLTTLTGEKVSIAYNPEGLRASGSIGGKPIVWENWANGGVYQSPYLTIKEGAMTVSDGKESYTLQLREESLEWTPGSKRLADRAGTVKSQVYRPARP